MIQQIAKPIYHTGNGSMRNVASYGHIQEYCRDILSRIGWPNDKAADVSRLLGVTGCRCGEGVSTIAASLAAAAAYSGDYRVLLVDANIDEPSAHLRFRIPLYPGWGNLLQDRAGADKSIRPSSIINLSVLAAGTGDWRTLSDGHHTEMPEMIKEASEGYDLAVFDLPPASNSNKASMAAMLDGVVLVVEAERTHCDEIRRTCDSLTRSGARILGVVMNKYQQSIPEWLARAL
jgi:capsular exopolysaccharide synthesis family protein